ncbi:MAG TPA: hypothetical protein VE673_14525 [Pseudonocardiaceae bacterium]|nr:hypothetical protein [Pseudonocardiaceae bacterium]
MSSSLLRRSLQYIDSGGQRYGILGAALVLLAGLLTALPVRTANPVNGETAMASRAARHCSVLP